MTDQRLWHGGAPGLKTGDLLLPPSVTGVVTTAQWMAARGFDPHTHGVEADRMRLDRVYLTHDKDLARANAGCWTVLAQGGFHIDRPERYGSLYVARPVGESGPDPDLPDDSIECERAEIVAVYDPAVILPARKIDRVMLSKVGAR